MPKKVTKEEFITRSNIVHSSTFCYDKVVYINLRTKVIIGCPIHGDFEQTPEGHLIGLKCRKCTNKNSVIPFSVLQKKFNEIHDNKYHYDESSYVNTRIKMNITCPEHGVFKQTPQSHSKGHGCAKCGRKLFEKSWRLNTDIFTNRSNEIHNFKFDYSQTNYIDNKTKVKIGCPDHGIFEQQPSLHLRGTDCPKCSSLNKGYYSLKLAEKYKKKFLKRRATVYLLNIFNNEESFYKIGVTASNLMLRFSGLNINYSYKQIERIETNLYEAIYLENKIIDSNLNKYKPKHYFCGETECFSEQPKLI